MLDEQKGQFYSGTSGLLTPIPKRDFPEEFKDKSRLCFYSSLFNSIEINSSFYKLPLAKTLSKWAGEVNDNFRFTFKLWKEITHNKGLEFKPDDVKLFMDAINSVGHKKGSLLVQFPPSLQVSHKQQLNVLLDVLRETDHEQQWDIAIEFRHKSWYRDDVYELLENNKMALVLQDIPASATPMLDQSLNFVYVRYHGPNGGYRGSYEDDFLSEYAYYINDWCNEGKTVYAYFNNTIGSALANLQSLNGYLLNF
ncbi:DUF72 domain-containing protein [Mucilaginibacter sp. KACC 22063]|uniref:DUF72 domain-containing protein n=1 Tax=Mucilaginibacter sp. KACC 22063 TaxID=3025666 RepID=UPI002366DF8F|nr:DUF72 domain-containing protein [Mucilaginibacter sp. KACC 22063]WDF55229.1 DUF72 domain-containing protein [Mucilaginibacter sp. KACC 22063]